MYVLKDEHYAFDLSGGELCLDFANTVSSHPEVQMEERITSYSRLISWGKQADVLSDREEAGLLNEAERRSEEASAVHRRAIALREAIYHIFSAVVKGEQAKMSDVDVLNVELSNGLAHARLTQGEDGFAWDWEAEEGTLDRVLWVVARAAADLLTSDKLQRVTECASDKCGWLFMDLSRNHSRRWCDMNECGNRAKARRHYERTRKGEQKLETRS
ncbi:MAG TPA: ABATE domain-containing protein [Chloroflexia bacterium]|nr:ABATE domain-containing protein [Chloroflexia bacterium]